MMSSSNNDYNDDGNNNGVYPLSLYLSSLSGHQEIIRNPYNHQLTASPGQMVSAVPDSLIDYMAFNSNSAVNQQGFDQFPDVSKEIKKVVKKDRHSKIHTAQGLRDRRVRLSIGIARQFFDLQDMLGFDKASKTLDWLLKKSRKAIKEVVQEKNLNNDDQIIFGNNGGDVEGEKGENDDEDGDNSFVYGSSPEQYREEEACETKKTEKRKKSDLSTISSKGLLRSKSRGKAKERTRKLAYDHPDTISEITQSEIMDPFKSFYEGEDMTHSFYKEAIKEFDNQESVLTKRKTNLPTNMGQSYNQHNGTFMFIDQDASSNYSTIDLPHTLDYNYDQNPFVDQTFCAVTDTNFPRGFP